MFDIFQKLMPKEARFFDFFEQHAALLVEGAAALERMLEGGEAVPHWSTEINRLESEADQVTREVLLAVRRTFITPFDRGDIQGLTTSLDDAIDQMQKTARATRLFEVTTFEPNMREMGALISAAAKVTADAVPLLRDLGRNGTKLTALTEKIIRLEGQADEVHNNGLTAAFRAQRQDPMGFYVTSDIYDHLEKVMDRYEDVADQLSGILVEHI
ncbi:MAG TPA: DUF47 domain-containing protein [Caulobacteraceae bacterium]|jgi:hypothetical protein|nr:DUF47 domain-containing protein [Caulobacteraceae bacterium]